MSESDFKKEFADITGFEILSRRTNYLGDSIKRKDRFFSALARLYFLDRNKFLRVKRKIHSWIKSVPSETVFSLAGYIFYIDEDFVKAKKYFLLALHKNPNNLDNWIDLAFVLRHLTCYKMSNCILFHYKYLMHYYRVLNIAPQGCDGIKKMALKVLSAFERE